MVNKGVYVIGHGKGLVMPPGFRLHSAGDLGYLTVPSFEKYSFVAHAFTTRQGGVSEGPYCSLNMGLHVGDTAPKVRLNRASICRLLGTDLSRLVSGRQVHGSKVAEVGATQAGRGALDWDDALPDVDALVTDRPGLLLSSYYADCVPLFFLDPNRRAIALAHAGWKGTVDRIGSATVNYMIERYGCKPGDILAAVGPSIGPCCYEVDQQVMDRVAQCLPGHLGLAVPGRAGHWQLDLPEMNRRVLLEAGLSPENITMSGYCTFCYNDLFFSYRRDKGVTGRMASLIMLTGGC